MAFDGCKLISTIHIPVSVQVIGVNAFLNYSRLKEVDLCEVMENIFNVAFQKCIVENIHIPSTAKMIDACRDCMQINVELVDDLVKDFQSCISELHIANTDPYPIHC
jgi:hypothetical protein